MQTQQLRRFERRELQPIAIRVRERVKSRRKCGAGARYWLLLPLGELLLALLQLLHLHLRMLLELLLK